ncbi:MAG: TonB-dependent receptor, partial [Saprospiraceae bacterium]
DINIGNDKWGFLTSASFSDYNDLRTGANRTTEFPNFGKREFYVESEDDQDNIVSNANPNIQKGTAYNQYDFLQKILYQPSEVIRIIGNFQYSSSSDIPRYDALTELKQDVFRFAEWKYGPQKRFFSSLRMDINKKTNFFDKIIFIAAYQRLDEDRIVRKYNSIYRRTQEEDLKVLSFTFDFHKYLDEEESFEINYGAEYNYNKLKSTAWNTDIKTLERSNVLTRYPSGGSSTNNGGAYILVKKNLKNISLFGGVRYSNSNLNVKYDIKDDLPWPMNYYQGVSSNNAALSWSLGSKINANNNWSFQGQISSAFRSPNIDDLAKIRVKTTEISVPNLDLQPEKSINGEISVSKSIAGKTNVSITGFVTALNDAIVREQFTFLNGDNYLIDENDTLYTIANVNAAKAKVKGLSINLQSSISKHIGLKGSVSYIRGFSTDNQLSESPLSHIPPLYGKLYITYTDDSQSLQFGGLFNAKKPLNQYGGSEDNIENATPQGTPSWYILNMYYNRKLSSKLSASFGFENILDIHYRPFASGVSAPGRNLIVSVNYKF